MKKFVFILLASVSGIFFSREADAQGKYGADSAECIKYLSYYKEYFKQKNYDAALPNWRKAYSLCPPTANQNMLIDGTTLLRRLISANAKNPEYKNKLVDSLLAIHDLRAKYYEKYAVTALNNKGLDLINYEQDNSEKLYDGLNDIIAKTGDKVKSTILLLNFKAAVDRFKKEKMNTEDVLSLYQRNMGLLDEIIKTSKDKEFDLKVKTDLESLFITSKVASCDKLLELFTPRYEADPQNLDLVTNIVKMLSCAENCTGNDLYLKAATSMYKLNPSSQSAYFLYKLHASRDNASEAVKYLEEAIASKDADPVSLADYSYQLAAYCLKNNMYAKAFNAAQKMMDYDKSMSGKAYFLMGTIWASVPCSGDEITARAKYWVATDFLQKAKSADSSLTTESNNLINQYSAYFPTAADAFMYNLTDGQSYTASCGGLRAVTTVRTQK